MTVEVTLDGITGEYTETTKLKNNNASHDEICKELDDEFGFWLAYKIL